MKKVKVIFNGAYEDVKSYEKLPQWDWEKNPVFEGWLLKSRHGIITQNSPEEKGGASVYELLHKLTKERYNEWGCTVLNDRLSGVGNLTDVRITSLPKLPGKKYKNFKVEVDKDSVFNPADFPNLDIKVSQKKEEGSGYKEISGKQEQAQNKQEEKRYVSEDDLPF